MKEKYLLMRSLISRLFYNGYCSRNYTCWIYSR